MTGFVFLRLKFKESGEIKGVSQVAGVEGWLLCRSLNWGMDAKDEYKKNNSVIARKVSIKNVVVERYVDESSTRIFNAMKKRDSIEYALISVMHLRPSGEGERTQLLEEMVSYKFVSGEILSVDLNAMDNDVSSISEKITMRFHRVEFFLKNSPGNTSNVKSKNFVSVNANAFNEINS